MVTKNRASCRVVGPRAFCTYISSGGRTSRVRPLGLAGAWRGGRRWVVNTLTILLHNFNWVRRSTRLT